MNLCAYTRRSIASRFPVRRFRPAAKFANDQCGGAPSAWRKPAEGAPAESSNGLCNQDLFSDSLKSASASLAALFDSALASASGCRPAAGLFPWAAGLRVCPRALCSASVIGLESSFPRPCCESFPCLNWTWSDRYLQTHRRALPGRLLGRQLEGLQDHGLSGRKSGPRGMTVLRAQQPKQATVSSSSAS